MFEFHRFRETFRGLTSREGGGKRCEANRFSRRDVRWLRCVLEAGVQPGREREGSGVLGVCRVNRAQIRLVSTSLNPH